MHVSFHSARKSLIREIVSLTVMQSLGRGGRKKHLERITKIRRPKIPDNIYSHSRILHYIDTSAGSRWHGLETLLVTINQLRQSITCPHT